MNRKQRRAAAGKKKIDLASAPANAGWHKDIVLAKSLYFSAHPGAGMGNNGSGAAGDVQAAGRRARELVKRRLSKPKGRTRGSTKGSRVAVNRCPRR